MVRVTRVMRQRGSETVYVCPTGQLCQLSPTQTETLVSLRKKPRPWELPRATFFPT